MAKYVIEIDTDDLQAINISKDGKEIPAFLVNYSFEQNENYPEESSEVEFEIIHIDNDDGLVRLHKRSGEPVAAEILGERKKLNEVI